MKTFRSSPIIFLVVVLLAACNLPNFHLGKLQVGEIRLGMAGSNQPGRMNYSFSTFTGFERGDSQVEAGQILSMDYTVAVRKGSLYLEVLSPAGEIAWQAELNEDAQDRFEVLAEESGRYAIVVRADNAGGSFEVSWEVR